MIARALDLKRDQEPKTLHTVQSPMHDETISELRRSLVVDFRPYDDGIHAAFAHADQPHAKFLCEQCPRDFDETQIRDVVHDAGTVRVEKHYLHFGSDGRSISCVHFATMSTRAHLATLIARAVLPLPATAVLCSRCSV